MQVSGLKNPFHSRFSMHARTGSTYAGKEEGTCVSPTVPARIDLAGRETFLFSSPWPFARRRKRKSKRGNVSPGSLSCRESDYYCTETDPLLTSCPSELDRARETQNNRSYTKCIPNTSSSPASCSAWLPSRSAQKTKTAAAHASWTTAWRWPAPASSASRRWCRCPT